MDVDAYAAAHAAEWQRLDDLLGRRGLSGAEIDELVGLYQRTATHLSVVRSSSPDPALVSWLTRLVARARFAVTGALDARWRDAARFLAVGFPAACYRSRAWWLGVAAAVLGVATVIAAWIAGDPQVQASIAAPEEVRRLVEVEFEAYYSSNPAASFAFGVWVNNAWIAAMCLVAGVLTLPVLYVLWQNTLSLGVTGGLMAANDRLDLFFGLITPHGLLELTAVFVAAGAGLRLGWTLIDPGPRPRGEAVAAEGRATVAMALGVAVLLAVSGVIEAFVTPSGLPTWARVSIGVLAELLFLAWVWLPGRRAARAGETGDVADAGDVLPSTA